MTGKYKIEKHHLNGVKERNGRLTALCPFHDDTNPSLFVYINQDTGDQMFKCFVCGKFGNAYQYLTSQGIIEPKKHQDPSKQEKGSPEPQKEPETAKKRVHPPKKSDVKRLHSALLEAPNALKRLETERKWTLDTIKRFKIGYLKKLITIPVYIDGQIANIKVYNPFKIENQPKMRSWGPGLGARVDLYPKFNPNEPLILMEGEPDTILARQMDLNAVTFTAGVTNIKPQHLEALKNLKISIVFDIDEPGKKAAQRIARYLEHTCPEVKIINLPITEPENGDFTDWVIKHGGTAEKLTEMIKATMPFDSGELRKNPVEAMSATDVDLEAAGLAEHSKIKQRTVALVAGKDTEPYLIPAKVKVECTGTGDHNYCFRCPIEPDRPDYVEFTPYDPDILKIIGNTHDTARGIYRRILDIPASCKQWAEHIEISQNVEDLILIPELSDDAHIGKEYITRRALFVGGMIGTNQPYTFTGYTAPSPYTHKIVHVYEQAEPTARALDTFEITPQIINDLKVFQVDNGQHPMDKLEDIADAFEKHVTHIVNRPEIIYAICMSLFSILKFKFAGKDVRRGWVETLIVGDPRTGKSETAATLLRHCRAGEMIGAENISFAGLVGGIDQHGARRILKWGVFPLNDGRAVVLDEFSGMDPEEVGRLSGLRASGRAEIVKIQTHKTNARVRLVVLSNPRTNDLGHYNMGIEAIRHLIGKPEDIARFDYALTVRSDEVSTADINKTFIQPDRDLLYTSDLCHNLIRWTWTRKPEHIEFTDKAVDLILWLATDQAAKYHPSIPLVEPAEQRIKLARLSASVAAQVFNSPDGKRLVIEPRHTEAAYNIMEAAYKKDSMRYDQYSQNRKFQETIRNKGDVRFRMLGVGIHGLHGFLGKGQFSLADIEELANKSRGEARDLATFLTVSGCFRKPHQYYIKTPQFTNLLTELQIEIMQSGDDGQALYEAEAKKQRGELDL